MNPLSLEPRSGFNPVFIKFKQFLNFICINLIYIYIIVDVFYTDFDVNKFNIDVIDFDYTVLYTNIGVINSIFVLLKTAYDVLYIIIDSF